MFLASGTRLGAYEIVSALGAGGMGEVYRARDTKLGRDVALKMLPEIVAQDTDRIARFKREAQLLAALNHPHIAAIYGFEEAGTTQFLVLELVEGETLADRLKRGPIPVDDAIAIARQIAEALAEAHEKDIIHRDLKPANVALSGGDKVKMLDFGLAKLAAAPGAASSSVSMSPTLTTPAMMTGVGMILCTAAYMAPEQAKGREADKRSDLWAFGCVVYEMLTARRAFEGEDITDTVAAIMRDEPDWSVLPARTPANVRTLLQRCLAKDRRQRLSDIAVALFLLNEPLSQPTPIAPAVVAPPPLWQRALPLAAAAIVASAITAAVVWNLRPPSATQPRVTRFPLMLAEGQVFISTRSQLIAISPDGAQIVYVASNRLFLRAMSDPEARAIAGTEGMGPTPSPTFSPDGRSIAYWASSDVTLKRIAVSGGAPSRYARPRPLRA
jgi:serine/threonine protein kinase